MKNINLLNEPDSTELLLNSSISDGVIATKYSGGDVDGGREKHPAIQQYFALGYEVGDRVAGRNISTTEKNKDWAGTLEEDNIRIQEYSWKTGTITLDGEYHEDGLAWLHEENAQGKQIYFNVNAGRKNAEVSRIFSIFFEHDTGSHAEQMAQVLNFPIPASVAVKTRKSTHTYYTVYGDDIESIEGWVKLQEKMAYTMGSDPAVKDRPRLMRLAGFDHIKTGVENVLCSLEICDGDNSYTFAEIEQAIAEYALRIGVKPFTEDRFKAYQFVINRLNQKKDGRDYSHVRFNPEFFRTCEDSEIAEQLQRCKAWARLSEQKHLGKGEGIDPETAWTDDVKTVTARVKKEYNIDLVPSLSQGGELLTVKWARAYTEGFEENGRSGWHTTKCPNHAGNSDDSLHINTVTGALKCHSGCDSHDVEVRLRQLAKDAGDESWNVERYKGQNKAQEWLTAQEYFLSLVAAEQLPLNTLTIKPGYTHILCPDGYTEEIIRSLGQKYIALLISPTGGGKTWFMDKTINYKESCYSNVLSVVPTIALSHNSAKRLGLNTREEVDAARYSSNAGRLASRMSLVTPSLYKQIDRAYNNDDFFLVDETRQGLNFLLNSDLCDKKGRRPKNIKAFNKAVKKSDRIILADAYATDVELDYFVALRPDLPVFVLEIPVKPIEREVYEVSKESYLDDKLKTLLLEEKRVIVPVDGQEKGEGIDREFTALGKKVLRVDAKTKNDEQPQLFLANPTKYLRENHIDLFIYSPTLGSGFDFKLKPEDMDLCFDTMISYDTHFAPTDFMQLVGRDRQREPLYYHCSADKNDNIGSVFVQDQIDAITRHATNLIEMAEILATTDLSLQMQAEELNHWVAGASNNLTLTTIAKQRAREAYNKQNRAEKVRQQFQKDGYTVIQLTDEDFENVTNEVNKAIKQHRAEIKEEKAIAVVAATLVDDETGKALLEKDDLTEKERHEADRYRMEVRYPGFLTNLILANRKEAEEFYLNYIKDKGRWLKTVYTRWAYDHREKVKPSDLKRLGEKVSLMREFGEGSLNDLKKIKSPFYQFVEDIGLFEFFRDGGRIGFNQRIVAGWLFKIKDESKPEDSEETKELNRLSYESKLNELMSFSGLKFDWKIKKDFKAKFITPLAKEYTNGLKDYFDFNIPASGYDLDQLIKSINSKILSKFGYGLTEKDASTQNRCFTFEDLDKSPQDQHRQKLVKIIEDEANKKNADFTQTNAHNVGGASIPGATPNTLDVYTKESSGVQPETHAVTELQELKLVKSTKNDFAPVFEAKNQSSESKESKESLDPTDRMMERISNEGRFSEAGLRAKFLARVAQIKARHQPQYNPDMAIAF
ncbi:hypothetical protein [Nostoc sp.]|uniref:hypothetical protein n=1 Tax=Nostoc sp. TaxID=1180 RepID=UPI002FFCA6DE